MCFSTRETRVWGRFAPDTKRWYSRWRPGVSASNAAFSAGSESSRAWSSAYVSSLTCVDARSAHARLNDIHAALRK